MPTTAKRETALIRLFVSAHENGTWAADALEIPDEKFDGGVDGFITRTSDGCDKALNEKLPKLVSAIAEKRVLLLEREQMMLSEQTIRKKIEARASGHPELTKIDIWFAETVFYSSDGAVDFKRYEDNKVVESLMFFGNRLKMKSDHGFATIVERI